MADAGIAANPALYDVAAVLRDGSAIRIRAIRPDDKQRLHDHFEHLSAQSVYFRFMGAHRDLSADELKRLTELDFKDHVGLAATLVQNGAERFIGVGRYFRSPKTNRAEVAFAIVDDYQGHGIGTILLEHLERIARAAGVAALEADVLGSNHQMLEVFAHSGFKAARTEGGVVHLTLALGSGSDLR